VESREIERDVTSQQSAKTAAQSGKKLAAVANKRKTSTHQDWVLLGALVTVRDDWITVETNLASFLSFHFFLSSTGLLLLVGWDSKLLREEASRGLGNTRSDARRSGKNSEHFSRWRYYFSK
jgi:hypothetical protein